MDEINDHLLGPRRKNPRDTEGNLETPIAEALSQSRGPLGRISPWKTESPGEGPSKRLRSTATGFGNSRPFTVRSNTNNRRSLGGSPPPAGVTEAARTRPNHEFILRGVGGVVKTARNPFSYAGLRTYRNRNFWTRP